jgi:hypothetical protein
MTCSPETLACLKTTRLCSSGDRTLPPKRHPVSELHVAISHKTALSPKRRPGPELHVAIPHKTTLFPKRRPGPELHVAIPLKTALFPKRRPVYELHSLFLTRLLFLRNVGLAPNYMSFATRLLFLRNVGLCPNYTSLSLTRQHCSLPCMSVATAIANAISSFAVFGLHETLYPEQRQTIRGLDSLF